MVDQALTSRSSPCSRLTALGQVDGLDVARGLLLLNNNESLYLQCLNDFIEAQSYSCRVIHAAISLGDFARAELATHTVAGQAAYLGAIAVERNARLLEHNLSSDASRLPELFALFQTVQRSWLSLCNGILVIPSINQWTEK